MKLIPRPLLLAAILAALISTTSLGLRSSKCPKERDLEMDLCASRMGFLGDHSFVVPKNLTSMTTFCDTLKSSIGCIQNYSRECLQGFTRQLLTSLLKRGKQQYSLICLEEASRREFQRKMSCLTDDKIDQFHLCMDASIARFEHIAGQVRSANRLPALCCSYQIFNKDVDETLSRLCPANVGRRQGGPSGGGGQSETNQFVRKVVGGTAGEFFSLVCDNHRSLDECRASDKTRDSLKKLEQVTKQVRAGKVRPKSKSLIPVLLEILDNSEPI